MHDYHSAYGTLPPGSNPQGFTVVAQLLPFFEQDNLYKQINFTVSANNPSNAGATGTTIKILLCPSDRTSALPTGQGGNNYFANYGTEPFFFQNRSVANGVFAARVQRWHQVDRHHGRNEQHHCLRGTPQRRLE